MTGDSVGVIVVAWRRCSAARSRRCSSVASPPSAKPAGADTPSSRRARSSPRWATPPSASTTQRRATRLVTSLNDGTGSPTRPAAPSTRQRQLLRDRRHHRRHQRIRPRRHARRRLRQRSARTRSRWSSTTRATSTSVSRPRPTSPSSPSRAARADIGPVATELRRRRLDRPRPATSAPSITPPRAPTSCATTSAPTTQLPNFNQASALTHRRAAGRPSSSRSCPTATSSWRTPNRGHAARPQRQRDPDLLLRLLAGCARAAVRHEPRPRRHLVLDRRLHSGDIWQVDIATGNVLQTIDTHSGYLFGLSVDDQIEVAATPPPSSRPTPTTLDDPPVTGDFFSPTPVSAVLTNSGHRHADLERAGDVHPERLRDVHGRHRRHRHGHLCHHAGRALEFVHADGILLGRHVDIDTRGLGQLRRAPSP